MPSSAAAGGGDGGGGAALECCDESEGVIVGVIVGVIMARCFADRVQVILAAGRAPETGAI